MLVEKASNQGIKKRLIRMAIYKDCQMYVLLMQRIDV